MDSAEFRPLIKHDIYDQPTRIFEAVPSTKIIPNTLKATTNPQ